MYFSKGNRPFFESKLKEIQESLKTMKKENFLVRKIALEDHYRKKKNLKVEEVQN
jgi:hypothetical protein